MIVADVSMYISDTNNNYFSSYNKHILSNSMYVVDIEIDYGDMNVCLYLEA